MIKSKLIDIERLSEWFGGSATLLYNISRREYIIIIRNDDLLDEFIFWFTEFQYWKEGEKFLTEMMLKKYLETMRIEQRLIQKGVNES